MPVKRTGPLTGMKVLEVATFIAGPFAGQLLGDLGADVIKVEPPGGDPFRGFNVGGYGTHFVAYNRNKRSIVVDQKSEDAQATMRKLVEWADVFLENARPGVWDRMGLGYQTVREWNPSLIYCSVSGFGKDGPWAARPAFDGVGQGLSGMASQLLDTRKPGVIGPAFSDCISGMTAAYSILAAYIARQQTGQGQHVDVAMLAATAAFLNSEASSFFQDKQVYGPRQRAQGSQSFAFGCSDGKMLTAHVSAVDRFWDNLIKAAGRQELGQDERFKTRPQRVKNFDLLESILAEEFVKRPRAEWEQILEEADVPYAPVLTLDEVFETPQAKHLGMKLTLQHPKEREVTLVGPPARFSETPWGDIQAAPTLGEHTDEVRAELGIKPSP